MYMVVVKMNTAAVEIEAERGIIVGLLVLRRRDYSVA